MCKLGKVIYVDTREGAPGMFACPPGEKDYDRWLTNKYVTSNNVEGQSFGVAQHVNSMLYQARRKGYELIAIGKHAGQAAKVLEKLSKNHSHSDCGLRKRRGYTDEGRK